VIIITGGCGFIGSNLVKALNASGREDLIVVDEMSDGNKFSNIAEYKIEDYLDIDEFRKLVKNKKKLKNIEIIFHQGACSNTREQDGRYMMDNNYEYSKEVLQYCLKSNTPLVYASSAAVYGRNDDFIEDAACESPINVYAYSKLLFDQYVRRVAKNVSSQIVGLRYFNVYGPGEAHKASMASVAYQLNNQMLKNSVVKLFVGSGGYSAGEQKRDFIHIDDVAAINLWFMERPEQSGIFNVGTGVSRSFNDVATSIVNWHQKGKLEYVDFPEGLENNYQSFTQANLDRLRGAGCDHAFKTLEDGMKSYLACLNKDR
jgi:ADP-L-glycero-D-manno-heptose 6-epimerase